MKERINKIFKFIKAVYLNRIVIKDALLNAITANRAKRKLAKERLDTCKKCPFYSKNTRSRPFGYLPFKHCTKCGCSIALKKYSKTNTCPKNLWKN